MINQVVLVGRLAKDPIVKEKENGKKVGTIVLAVTRNWKNQNGDYETDFIDCILFNSLADRVIECCEKGDVVAIKGCIQTKVVEKKGIKKKKTGIVVEKVTFLVGKTSKERNDNFNE